MDKINILGVNITNITRSQVLNKIQEFLNGQKQHFIVTPNPEIILEATEKDEELHYILNHADLALADGVALKFAAWFYGRNLKRSTGADLVIDILKLAEEKKYKVAVFNWNRGLSSADEIKSTIIKKFPKLELYVQEIERDSAKAGDIPATPLIKGVINPPYPPLLKGANNFAPDIIFSTLGFPYQEKFIYYNLAKMPSAKLGLAVGGSFDFLTGKAKRAPKFLRQIGLEWLWRLVKQPKRAARIYRATVIFPFRFFVFFFILRWFYRPNVACLLYKKEIQPPFIPPYQGGDKKNVKYKILIVERVGETGHWQLPQGGTDGEDLRVAGARELKEELNTENFKSIAVFKDLFKYKFDKRLNQDGLSARYQTMKNQRGYKGQKQSLFIAEFTGADSEIKVNLWEHSAWRWAEAEKLIESVHPVRREATKIFMERFWETVKNKL